MSKSEYDFFKDRNNRKENKSDKTKKKWMRCKEAIERWHFSTAQDMMHHS